MEVVILGTGAAEIERGAALIPIHAHGELVQAPLSSST